MKDVQCYEFFGGIALKNHAFLFSFNYNHYTYIYILVCVHMLLYSALIKTKLANIYIKKYTKTNIIPFN